MRLAWATDIHLDAAGTAGLDPFVRGLGNTDLDALVVTGDIGNADRLANDLEHLLKWFSRPVYFVLGNHDYYGSSFQAVREQVHRLVENNSDLIWLPEAGVISLTDRTALVGHGSWADGRFGDYQGSRILLNDHVIIDEFAALVRGRPAAASVFFEESVLASRLDLLHRLGDETAAYLAQVLPAALRDHEQVVLATHVPPFREACWHEGEISNDDWLPHMSCKAVGEVLRSVMEAHPDRDLLVLCGHTHGEGEVHILPNLLVRTGGARYGAPHLQDILDIA